MSTPYSLQARLWQEVFFLSVALFGLLSIWLWPLLEAGNMTFLMSVVAGTSGILLAMSFSLSSFAYYFDFLDDKVVYRKQLGLMGYFFAIGYAVLAVGVNPALYIYSFPENLFTVEVGFGAVSMIILTIMALISNIWAVKILGGKLWKRILSLGYSAYAILIIRGFFLDALLWERWLRGEGTLFTVRMALAVLGIAVLLFRISVPLHKKYSKKTQYV